MEDFVKQLKKIWPKKPHFLNKHKKEIEKRPIWYAYLYSRYMGPLPLPMHNYIVLNSFANKFKEEVQSYIAWHSLKYGNPSDEDT